MLSFVASIQTQTTQNGDFILLALFLQSDLLRMTNKLLMLSVYVRDVMPQNKGNSSNHFDSIGGSFGFGAHWGYSIKKNSISLMGQFSFKTRKRTGIFSLKMILLRGCVCVWHIA